VLEASILDDAPVGVDPLVGEAALAGIDELGEPAVDELRPPLGGERLAAGQIALGLGFRDVLRDSAPVHPEASGDLGLLPSCVPVREDLDDVDHGEASPCHRCLSLGNEKQLPDQGAQVVDARLKSAGLRERQGAG
jgi:hypothetical protein